MRNPRPCVCGHQEGWHYRAAVWPGGWSLNACSNCQCNSYRPAPRTEPLRAWRPPLAVPVAVRAEVDEVVLRGLRSMGLVVHRRETAE